MASRAASERVIFPGQHGYPPREHDDATFYPLSTATVTEGGGAARTVSPWLSANNRRSLPEAAAYGASGERSDPARAPKGSQAALMRRRQMRCSRALRWRRVRANLRDEVAS
jgi:hypothetical protein